MGGKLVQIYHCKHYCHIIIDRNTGPPYFLPLFCAAVSWIELSCRLAEENDTPHTFQTHPPFSSVLFHCSSVGQLGIDIRPFSADSIPTCLRAIKLSARIYSRRAVRKAKKLSPPAHVRGQRAEKRSKMEARV